MFRRIGPRIRKIAICHNARPHEGGWLDRIASRLVLSQVDALIAHSTEEAETLRAALPGKACARSFHPIYDQERPSAPRSELRRRLGLAGPTLLFFGFVRPYKRLDLLLRALPAVRRRYPDVRLLVVGEFWKDSRREAEAILRGLELSDAVTIVDAYVSGAEMAEYVTAADLAVLPYASVTGSGVLQTAYGLGRPVVATRCGCFAEMVRDGEDGVLVAPDDADALAGGICRALAPETLARLTEGAAGAPERFAWSRMVRTIESLAGGSAAGESR
ncbi:MAG: glycosyltransferase family 4 protein [Planctomycetes bacterium]|nr:glycosyltransferase family 4 protein [Planctomycetota bacterium]